MRPRKITVMFHPTHPTPPDDLLASVLSLVPEGVEVTNFRAREQATLVLVEVTVRATPAEVEAVTRSLRAEPGLPPADVLVGGRR